MPRRAVKPADEAPDERGRNGQPRRDIFGKAQVIGGGEGKAVVEAPAPSGKPERNFSRNMDGLRGKGADTESAREPAGAGGANRGGTEAGGRYGRTSGGGNGGR